MKQSVVRLNKAEVKFYFAAFSIGVFYSLYQLYLACSKYFDNYQNDYDDFARGWSWVRRKQDNADEEWTRFISSLKRMLPWVVVQLIVSQFLKNIQSNPTVICGWYIIVSTTFLIYNFGTGGFIYLMISPCLACLLVSLRSKKIAYLFLVGFLAAMEFTPLNKIISEILALGEHGHYVLFSAFYWMQLRSLSCCIDNIVDYKHVNILGFLNYFIQSTAYCLYLPTLIMGPMFLHSKFIKGINQPPEKWNLKRIRDLLFNLMRYTFWIYFTELALHFVYPNILEYHPDIVEKINPWAFYGLGYCMGQYFCNKYIISYGIPGELTRADDINAPPPPKCIGRIHLYSEMWKQFDRGLYEFLVKYIYIPILQFNIPLKKFVASFLTFAFIWIWHGVHTFVLLWSTLNFLGVTIEAIAKSIGSTPGFINWQEKYLSPRNMRRFNCAITVPLLALSIISNFYFFAGVTIGNIYFYRLFHDSTTTIVILFSLLYCLAQVSTEMKIIESQRVKGY